ncbi:tRNA preQ1(34) S-adenosylmethionine ribosyltransferase-isomerase QueA [Brevundimonas sp. 2R-24]|uniref:S-adenosylmethionine:tRNA ribosyltransferase-isomerase n=1 Tax=Peiella sedimenti TaxID=3061083 RepID=A0ABT8SMR0_9CAUL|nr:tRNA preQ1(34) S-adenosylmethionine ribosyltransferase-isomerase QueA [Caulobacteraceae bacterium XZ-24]
MRTADFDFHLPEGRIALRPASPRDSARLLLVRPGAPDEDRVVRDLPDLLQPGDVLVFNDTRVIPARLKGVRERDGLTVAVEGNLHKRTGPDRWTAFMKPGKRLKPGDRVLFGQPSACAMSQLEARVEAKMEDGLVELSFDRSSAFLDEAIRALGAMPLPPYIAAQRPEDQQDFADYQTVYAREDGSVAAPTAGLHFTPELLRRLSDRGVEQAFVTLHVGAGTFLPVKADDLSDHRMHAETGEVSAEVADRLNAVRARGGRIVCVGTTSLRLLESATGEDGVVRPFDGETDIFITPGYRFRAADMLMTNFHLPKSTLFMLVCAFAGTRRMKAAYAHAVETGYRFYSYGDGSLLFRAEP